MHEIDFLPIESDGESGSKCGDAIAVRFTQESNGDNAIIVIDAGYGDAGSSLAEHIQEHYHWDRVDLVVSTHPDADHINGIATLFEEVRVNRLMIHRPRNHFNNLSNFSNIEAVDNVISAAKRQNTLIVEPFQGVQDFDGQFTVLSPTETYYIDLIKQHLEEERTGIGAIRRRRPSKAGATLRRSLDKFLSLMPGETLDDEGDTGPRNNSSVVALLTVDGRRLMFTGDAGIPALELAAEYYEQAIGTFESYSLDFFQAPHHGSKRNVGPTILNRILGSRGYGYNELSSFISSAKACEDHPSPKVLNALKRRGATVCATEGTSICNRHNSPQRIDRGPIEPYGWVDEED